MKSFCSFFFQNIIFWVNPIFLFFWKEVHEEFNRPTNVFGVFFYLVCTTFIISLVTKGYVIPSIWSAFYWILMMFISFTVLNKHLNADEPQKWNYYYLIVHPIQFILARTFYYALFICILGILNFILLSLWIKNPISSYEVFFWSVLLGSLGLASSLTLISAIAVQSNHPTMLMSVLGFPLLIPLLWTLIKITILGIQGLTIPEIGQYWFFLVSIILISILLSIILFPMIWKE